MIDETSETLEELLHDAERAAEGAESARMMGDYKSAEELERKRDGLRAKAESRRSPPTREGAQ
jgi:hypothetical protein